jgi:hypothetical protein
MLPSLLSICDAEERLAGVGFVSQLLGKEVLGGERKVELRERELVHALQRAIAIDGKRLQTWIDEPDTRNAPGLILIELLNQL